VSEDQPRSGSRWEPPPDQDALPPRAAVDPPADPGPAASTRSWWERGRRVRPAVAAGIAAVALIGVGGGYAVGRAVEDQPTSPAGFSEDGPGHAPDGALPPGAPGPGVGAPGAPDLDDDSDLGDRGWDDDDGDHDGADDGGDDGDEASST
jgi:hypothetical protein